MIDRELYEAVATDQGWRELEWRNETTWTISGFIGIPPVDFERESEKVQLPPWLTSLDTAAELVATLDGKQRENYNEWLAWILLKQSNKFTDDRVWRLSTNDLDKLVNASAKQRIEAFVQVKEKA